MEKNLFFEIPEDITVRTELIAKLPDGWTSLSGNLLAPREVIDKNPLLVRTGFRFGRTGASFPEVVGPYDVTGEKRWEPDMASLVGDNNTAGFVEIDDLERRDIRRPFDVVWKTAIKLLARGYTGWLSFSITDPQLERGVLCSIVFDKWPGEILSKNPKEVGMQPSRVRLTWKPSFEAQAEVVASYFRKFPGLKEYAPTPTSIPA